MLRVITFFLIIFILLNLTYCSLSKETPEGSFDFSSAKMIKDSPLGFTPNPSYASINFDDVYITAHLSDLKNKKRDHHYHLEIGLDKKNKSIDAELNLEFRYSVIKDTLGDILFTISTPSSNDSLHFKEGVKIEESGFFSSKFTLKSYKAKKLPINISIEFSTKNLNITNMEHRNKNITFVLDSLEIVKQ